MKRRWIEIFEGDDPPYRLSSTRIATLFVVSVLAWIEVKLVEAGATCQKNGMIARAVDCFGPVEALAETMALLAAGVYALARMRGIVEGIKGVKKDERKELPSVDEDQRQE